MCLFKFLKKTSKSKTNSINNSIDFVKYFYKPFDLFTNGQFKKAITFCDENYNALLSLVDKEPAFAYILFTYFNVIGHQGISSNKFSIAEAKIKEEENRSILKSYCDNDSSSHTAFWYSAYYAMYKNEINSRQRIELLEKGGALGNALAYYWLSNLYYPENRPNRDNSSEDKLFVSCLEKALKIYPDFSLALNDLGSAYFNGWGVNQDKAKALELYEKALAKGSTFALFNVGTELAETKPFRAFNYLGRYISMSRDVDAIRAAFGICIRLSKSDNPFELMRCYLFSRVLLGYSQYGDKRSVQFLLIKFLPFKPKLFRLIETMAYNSDKVGSFDVGGFVNDEVVARTRHNRYETQDHLAHYFNGNLSRDSLEESNIIDLFDKIFEPIPIDKLDYYIEQYDKAIYSIGISRVAETPVMDNRFYKPE